MGCHFLLQGISQSRDQTRVSCIDRWILCHLSHLGSPSKLTPLLQAACSFTFQNNSSSPIPAKSTRWGFPHLLWGPGRPPGDKNRRSVGPLGISIPEICPHWAFHGSSFTAQLSLPYHWFLPGLGLWVSTLVSCSSLYLPLCLCSLGGRSLPCDLTSLTGLRWLIAFSVCSPLYLFKYKERPVPASHMPDWKLEIHIVFQMLVPYVHCWHIQMWSMFTCRSCKLLNSFMAARRVTWRCLWILYVDNHVMWKRSFISFISFFVIPMLFLFLLDFYVFTLHFCFLVVGS